MTMKLAILAPHVPSICHVEKAPSFQMELVKGLKSARERINDVRPDLVVIQSCHFPATFFHYVDVSSRHKGVLTAVECPDLVVDVPYDYEGDTDIGQQLVDAGKRMGIPVRDFNDDTYVWDYGTLVPLRHLVPDENIPIVSLSVCAASPLEESYEWGKQIGAVLRSSDKNAVFVSSGALAHNLVRGRENWPTRSERAMDDQFISYLQNQQYSDAREMLSQYGKIAGVESGGRHLATLLGVLDENYDSEFLGYGPSSGSGNAVMTFVHQ